MLTILFNQYGTVVEPEVVAPSVGGGGAGYGRLRGIPTPDEEFEMIQAEDDDVITLVSVFLEFMNRG